MLPIIASLMLLQGASDLSQTIDARYQAAATAGFSGSMLVVKGAQPVLVKGYGFADPATKRANTSSTLFAIGSVTKWFTGLVVLRLEQDKNLALDDPIGKFIPNVPADKKAITIKQLLAHTAGFGEYIDRPGEGGDFAPIDKPTALKRILAEKLKFKPGSQSDYSNVGYTLLAMIVEKASGKTFDACVREFVFRPAGMTRSGFFGDTSWPATEYALGQNAKTHGQQNAGLFWGKPTWSIIGAGGIVSTCEDLGKAVLALTQGKIVSMANEPRMFQPLHEVEGFGWMVGKTSAGTPFCNVGGGDDFGFNASILYQPHEGNLVVSCSNSNTPRKIGEANRDVLRALK